MQKTTIEWVKNADGSPGYTWNPQTGCLRDCSYCYGRKIATRFAGSVAFPVGFEPAFWPERLKEPQLIRKHSRIFVCSMGELFGPWVVKKDIQKVVDVARSLPRHTFMFLTKFPYRLKEFNPWPANCWVGVSATDDEMAYDAYAWLREVDAPVRFMSFEPLLEGIEDNRLTLLAKVCDWFIVGERTQPTKCPHLFWVEAIRAVAIHYRVPLFIKDSLRKTVEELYADVPEWITTQEFPKEEDQGNDNHCQVMASVA